MPPKPKYTKEEIILAAFELAREEGIDSVVARSVGARLGTSATPIFTVFSSMDELKAEVILRAREKCLSYMDGVFDYTPAFKEFGMRWVRFSMEEPNLYHILFRTNGKESVQAFFSECLGSLKTPLLLEVSNAFGIPEADSELLLQQLMIFANGIAAFPPEQGAAFSEEVISSMLSQVCIGLAISSQLRNGSFIEPRAKAMAQSALTGVVPRRKQS